MKPIAVLAFAIVLLGAQTAPPVDTEQWKAIRFLEGTWSAQTQGSRVSAAGSYVFRRELGGHILARHSSSAGCKGPADFDCEHGDLLYIYEDAPGHLLKAIYFDNEGHVIHYAVSSSAPGSAMFISDPAAPGPQYRLLYELKGGLMSGKFQMRMPGTAEWKSYLEWTGARK